jgi:hypothetical protein
MLDLNYNSRFKALEGVDPSTRKQTNLVANSFSFKTPCVIKEFIINNVKLLV